MVKVLSFVSCREIEELGEIEGVSIIDIWDNATQSLIDDGHVNEEDLENSTWEKMNNEGGYILSVYDIEGAEKTFELV